MNKNISRENTMDNMIRVDKDYVEWLKHVKKDVSRHKRILNY